MGQNWWLVVLAAVVVVGLLVVAVALLRGRRRWAGEAPTNVEIAAAAAGGTAGAVGAGAVAATHAEEDVPAPAGESTLAAGAGALDAEAAAVGEAAEPGSTEIGMAADSDAEPDVSGSDDHGTGDSLREDRPDAVAGPGGPPEGDGAVDEPVAGGEAAATGAAAASIPAPREEQPLSGSAADSAERRPPEPRIPEPAGSALAALDAGLVGPATTFAAAAAAVSAAAARPGPYPGSLLPSADGSIPSPEHEIKANEGSRRFHTPDSPYYLRTRGDAWFRTAEEALAAGFTAWNA